MDRTLRATFLAAFIGFAAVAGTLLFLGLPMVPALGAGLVTGVLGGLLIWGAGRRADTFHTTDTVRPVEPSFPGPPQPADERDADPRDERDPDEDDEHDPDDLDDGYPGDERDRR